MRSKQIIICDDDESISESIAISLKNDGYKSIRCKNGKEAIAALNKNHVDLIIMDVMMPGEDGIKTVGRIRENSDVPIIFLSAKSELNDKLSGLSIGGDDYMTKPFEMLELKARVKSIIKRSSSTEEKKSKKQYKVGNLKVNLDTKQVTLRNKPIKLTPIEYKILLYFIKNPGKVLSSNDIYKEVWNESEAYNIENTIAVHIRHIREKIEKDSREPKYIKVVWGIGYKMEAL